MHRVNYNMNASLHPEVAAAMMLAIADLGSLSLRYVSKVDNQLVERAQVAISTLVGADPEWVTFVSEKEINNLSFLYHLSWRLLIMETACSMSLKMRGAEIIPINKHGIIDLHALESLLDTNSYPTLVAITLADNITGIIQPVAVISAIVHTYGGLLHCDATYATGKIVIDMNSLNIDSLTLTSHQLGGPRGIGALVARPVTLVDVSKFQAQHHKISIESIPSIAGLGAAAVVAMADLPSIMLRLEYWRSVIEDSIHSITPVVRIIGENVERLPNTISIAIPGAQSSLLAALLNINGIKVTYWESYITSQSILPRLGYTYTTTVVRVNLEWMNSQEDIDTFLLAWKTVASHFSLAV